MLTPDQQRDRLRLDHLLMVALGDSPCPIHIAGYRSAEDVQAGRNPIQPGDPNPPTHYGVMFDFDTLSGPGKRHRPTSVHIAPLANGAYPGTAPSAWVIGGDPWTPHFARNVPICHGHHVWVPYRTLLHDYTIHLARLLNLDEPRPTPGYVGYNGQAIAYWRDELGYGPLDPGLTFPVIRPEDVIRRDGAFGAAVSGRPSADRFASAAQSSIAPVRFRAAT